MAAMLLATIVIIELGLVSSSLGEMFGTTPVGLNGWISIIVASVIIIPFDLLRKIITNSITK